MTSHLRLVLSLFEILTKFWSHESCFLNGISVNRYLINSAGHGQTAKVFTTT